MHYIICKYVFGHVASCYPTSLLPPMGRVALDSMQKKKALVPWYKVDQAFQHDLGKFRALSEVLSIIYMGIYAFKRLYISTDSPKCDLIVLNRFV